MNFNLPEKIQLDQLEEGKYLRTLLDDFTKIRNEVAVLIHNKFTSEIVALHKSHNDLVEKVNNLETYYNDSLNRLSNDVKKDIDNMKSLLSNFVNKSDGVSIDELSDSLRKTLDDMAYKLDYLIKKGEDVPPDIDSGGGDTPPSGEGGGSSSEGSTETKIYQYDRNGIYRQVKWFVYFEASVETIVALNDIQAFKDDISKVIQAIDWYGPQYEEGDYSNQTVEVYLFNPTNSYLTEEEINDTEINNFEKAVEYINADSETGTYLPRTTIDNNDDYPLVEPFQSVSYNTDGKYFKFNNIATTDYILKVVKYYN